MVGPGSLIIWTIYVFPVIIFVTIAFIWKAKTNLILLITIMLTVGMLYYQFYQSEQKVLVWQENEVKVHNYLTEVYADEQWITKKNANLYSFFPETTEVEVIFINEPYITYTYVVDDEVMQVGYSIDSNYDEKDPQHRQ